MFDAIKNAMFVGVGLAAMTVDKVEELARDIAKSANLSSEKGQEFVEEVKARAAKARADLEATVQRLVKDNVQRTGLATSAEIARLHERIAELERRIAEQGE